MSASCAIRPRAVPRQVWVLVAVSLGQFLIQLDLTVVNVALPRIGSDLGASVSGLQWVVDGYNLAVASLLLIGGRVGDRSGHKRVYLTGLAVFAVGSGLCAVAPGPGWLIAFRVLQGVGAAIELPATLAILTHTFTDPRQRAQAVGIWAGAAGSALVVGPVLGGGMIAAFGWRAVFVVNLPVTVLIAFLTVRSVRERAEPAAGALDLPGQLLGSTALALLAAGAIEGGHLGFTAALPVGLLAAGLASLVAFLAIEYRQPDPVLALGLFRRPGYAAANANGLVMGFVTIGLLFLFALFFQQVQGQSAIAAGLRFLPLTVAFVLVGPLIGRVIDRAGHRAPMAAGGALLALGALLLLRANPNSGYGPIWWPFAIIGVGYGLLSTPMAAAVLGAVPRDRAGMASSTNLTARLVGGVFGIAVLGALLPTTTTHGTGLQPPVHHRPAHRADHCRRHRRHRLRPDRNPHPAQPATRSPYQLTIGLRDGSGSHWSRSDPLTELVADLAPLWRGDRVVGGVADGPVAGGGVSPAHSLGAGPEPLDRSAGNRIASVGLEGHPQRPPHLERVGQLQQLGLIVEPAALRRRGVPGAADLGDRGGPVLGWLRAARHAGWPRRRPLEDLQVQESGDADDPAVSECPHDVDKRTASVLVRQGGLDVMLGIRQPVGDPRVGVAGAVLTCGCGQCLRMVRGKRLQPHRRTCQGQQGQHSTILSHLQLAVIPDAAVTARGFSARAVPLLEIRGSARSSAA